MSSIDTSKIQIALAKIQTLKITDSLNYSNILNIRVSEEDILLSWDLAELSAAISAEILAEITKHWNERNIIDVAKNSKFTGIDLSSKHLAEIIRWHLRGMSIDLAVRKVRIEVSEIIRSLATKKAINHRLNQVIQGFKIGTKVILSDRLYHRKDMIGWEGVVVAIRANDCCVQFDLDPKQVNGEKRRWQLTYDYLSIVKPEPPKLKPTQKSKPSSKAIIKTKNILQSQDKPKYTAVELAQKLNVSKAKIYQMRSNGTLEASGYRSETNGRFILFMKIDG